MAALIHEWDGPLNTRMRLVFIPGGKSNDSMAIERLGKDTMGDPRWDRESAFELDPTKPMATHVVLLSAIESLVRRDPVLDAAHRTGGWDAVSAILRKKQE